MAAPDEPLPDAGQATSPEDALPDLSEPPPEMTLPEEVGETPEMQDLPSFLVGQDRDTVIALLQQAGWLVTAQTPGTVQLDRGSLGLDLELDNSTGRVVEAELVDLF
jgi:hypothetical protein